MRVAIVHDYLNQYGGAERVLETFLEMFPNAPLYTLFYDKEKTLGRFEKRVKATSFLDVALVRNNHRAFIPFMPLAAKFLSLSDEYDLVLSSSAGFGKGIQLGSRAIHISYCHTPLRYAWENYNYFNHWQPLIRFASAPAFSYLRWWDRRVGQKPHFLVANSHFIADKIERYYGREASIIYPPVDLQIFYPEKSAQRKEYFLAVGRLIHYKKFDLIIEAFNKLNLPLIIVGSGPETKRLTSLIRSPHITLHPFATEAELRALYSNARALIFPQEEDFGLVAAEAQACGTPVIAFAGGGAQEIVHDGVTGILFKEQTAEGIINAVSKFLSLSFNAEQIQKSAERFSKARFQENILNLVKSLNIG